MDVQWQPLEWNDDGSAATVEPGLKLEISPDEDGGWFWRVDLTAAVSEYPEIWDCGIASDETAAQACAVQAAENAAARLSSSG